MRRPLKGSPGLQAGEEVTRLKNELRDAALKLENIASADHVQSEASFQSIVALLKEFRSRLDRHLADVGIERRG